MKAGLDPARVVEVVPPLPLPAYKVKQHWHERFNADAGNMWLRQSMVGLFSGPAWDGFSDNFRRTSASHG